MNPIEIADWPRISELFDEGAELDPPARERWLARIEAEQPKLALPLRRLLQAHEGQGTAAPIDGDWLASSDGLAGLVSADARHAGIAAGRTIGRYRLTECLGHGGMAEVWSAEPRDGVPASRVALKIAARSDRRFTTRFVREREILASLEHAGIARLYDALSLDDGTPVLVMELVEGLPIDRHAQAATLDLNGRIDLFLRVLDAVQFAHSRGVVHRDLKPSNILVTPLGEPKLLDFGIAKLLDPGPGATALTQSADRLLTPAYAAPEQLSGAGITMATDVYSLGVLLFELLAGCTPYEPGYQSGPALTLAISEGRTRRLSSAARGGPFGPAHARALRGDLDAIVERALRRDPSARYDNARALAEDLRRHRSRQPVLARAMTPGYLLGRFVRRNRAATAAAGVALACLVGATVISLYQAGRANRERDAALAARSRAEATQRFMLDLLDEGARAGRALSMPELMQRAESLARQALADRPDERAIVLGIVGRFRIEAEGAAVAQALLSEAATDARDPQLRAELTCLSDYAAAHQGRAPEAARRLALAARDPDLGIAARAQCAMVLAQVLAQSMHFDAAAAAADQAWSFYRDQGPSAQNERATILAVRAITGLSQGRSAALDAEIGAQMHELQTAGRGRGQAAQGLLNVWGSLAMVAGQPRKAVERYRKLLEIYEADQGATATVAYHHLTAAAAAIAAGLDDDAERWLAGGLDKARREQAQAVRAGLLCQRARLTALRGGDASAIRQWLDTADTHLSHADSLAPNQRLFCGLVRAEAAAMRGDAVAALAIVDAPTGMVSMPSIELTRNLIRARAHLAAGRHELARERAQAAAALALQLAGDGLSARLGEAWLLVGLAHRAAGDAAAAGAAWQQALAQLEATVEPGQWARRETTRQLRKD